MKKVAGIGSIFMATPLIAFAQVGNLSPIGQLIVSIGSLITTAIPVLIGAAMVLLIWGVIHYIMHPDEHGKQQIIAGIIGLFVILSIWGIIRFAQVSLFGGTPGQTIPAPRFPNYQ
jgi:uncharacterized membrane protein YesL